MDRSVTHVAGSVEVMEGAGVMARRVLPSGQIPYEAVDPFLLLDDASVAPDDPGFPRHPHRGFEIITYLLSGSFGHADNLGNNQVVEGGGLQRITAGKGIWHSEMPGGRGEGAARGLQLWINLARAHKQVEPAYEGVQPQGVPSVDKDGARVRLLAGEGGAVKLRTPSIYLDAHLDPGSTFAWDMPLGHNAFAYVLEGQGEFGPEGTPGRSGQIVVFGDGDRVTARAAAAAGLRFVLCAGQPHGEPVLWRGPFVD